MSSKSEIDKEEVEIRGRMEIEDIVKYQINRCNVAITDPNPEVFNSNVLVLLDLLPAHKRSEVLTQKKEYGDDREILEYDKYWCGHPVTSTKKTVKKFIVDYHSLYRVVLDAFADSGLTWNIEPLLEVLKKVPVQQKKPTPYLKMVGDYTMKEINEMDREQLVTILTDLGSLKRSVE